MTSSLVSAERRVESPRGVTPATARPTQLLTPSPPATPGHRPTDAADDTMADFPAALPRPAHFGTDAVHVGQEPDPATGAVIPPISLSTTFKQNAPGEPKVRQLRPR